MVASRNPFRVLQAHRDFRTFWVGQTLSLVGSWMQTMALGWLALELSNSAFVVGLVAAIGGIPIVLGSLHVGAFVDRSDRLRLVKITQSVFLAEAVVLTIVTALGLVSVPILILLAFVQGMCSAVEIPARQSMIVELVGRRDLLPAIALNSSGFNLARVIGPAIGGLVIHRLGMAWCFALNAASYLAVLWGLSRIQLERDVAMLDSDVADRSAQLSTREPDTARETRNNTRGGRVGGRVFRDWRDGLRTSTTSVVEGLRFFLRPGAVRNVLLLVTIGALFSGSFLTLMPVVARDQLGLGASGYGGLLTSVGVGGLAGALFLAGPMSHWSRGRVLAITGTLFPVLLIALALAVSVRQATVVLFFTGVAMIAYNALGNGILQSLVPDEYRGRLMALYSLLFVGLSQLLGAFALGAAARAFGVSWAIGGSGAVTLALSLWTIGRHRLWRL